MDEFEYETYVDEQNHTRVKLRDGTEVCDFCLGRPAPWTYPVKPTPIPLASHPVADMSDDAWCACDQCMGLIETDDLEALITRGLDEQVKNQPPGSVVRKDGMVATVAYPPREARAKAMRQNIMAFLSVKDGPPTKEEK